jgi:hypothetical protein
VISHQDVDAKPCEQQLFKFLHQAIDKLRAMFVLAVAKITKDDYMSIRSLFADIKELIEDHPAVFILGLVI